MEERIIKDINNLLTQLFQKMHEAGYEWDAGKKELKKVEQNMELTDFESALFTAFSDAWQQYLDGEEVNVAQWAKEHSTELLEVARKEHVEWSEEDEEELEIIIDFLNSPSTAELCSTLRSNTIDWLKSLKDRVQPQKEWSEEDENRFNNLVWLIEHSDEVKRQKKVLLNL